MNQSKELSEFYTAIQKWICDNKAYSSTVFCSQYGLCVNLREYLKSTESDHIEHIERISEELKIQFSNAGLNKSYPFNPSGSDFIKERDGTSLYSNPNRLKWVKEHCGEGNPKMKNPYLIAVAERNGERVYETNLIIYADDEGSAEAAVQIIARNWIADAEDVQQVDNSNEFYFDCGTYCVKACLLHELPVEEAEILKKYIRVFSHLTEGNHD